MHLLNTERLKPRYFVGDVPPYVILSHTWDGEEVLFEDTNRPHASKLAGYDKVAKCCKQAQENGFQWA